MMRCTRCDRVRYIPAGYTLCTDCVDWMEKELKRVHKALNLLENVEKAATLEELSELKARLEGLKK